jgi:hypothetical protein
MQYLFITLLVFIIIYGFALMLHFFPIRRQSQYSRGFQDGLQQGFLQGVKRERKFERPTLRVYRQVIDNKN